MRGLAIAMMVLMFCLSVEVVNEAERQHMNITQQSVFGWKPQAPINTTHLPNINTKEEFNETVYDMMEPVDQPITLGLDTLFTGFNYMIKFVGFLINLLFNATINFFFWFRTMGRSDMVIVPDFIAAPVTAIVWINYLFLIGQLISKTNLKGGA